MTRSDASSANTALVWPYQRSDAAVQNFSRRSGFLAECLNWQMGTTWSTSSRDEAFGRISTRNHVRDPDSSTVATPSRPTRTLLYLRIGTSNSRPSQRKRSTPPARITPMPFLNRNSNDALKLGIGPEGRRFASVIIISDSHASSCRPSCRSSSGVLARSPLHPRIARGPRWTRRLSVPGRSTSPPPATAACRCRR